MTRTAPEYSMSIYVTKNCKPKSQGFSVIRGGMLQGGSGGLWCGHGGRLAVGATPSLARAAVRNRHLAKAARSKVPKPPANVPGCSYPSWALRGGASPYVCAVWQMMVEPNCEWRIAATRLSIHVSIYVLCLGSLLMEEGREASAERWNASGKPHSFPVAFQKVGGMELSPRGCVVHRYSSLQLKPSPLDSTIGRHPPKTGWHTLELTPPTS